MEIQSLRTFFKCVVLLTLLDLATPLECAMCNFTKHNSNETKMKHFKKPSCGVCFYPCELSKPTSCGVCLSSTYQVTSSGIPHTYVFKSCHMKSGNECSNFSKELKVQHAGDKVKQIHCYVCEENGCNTSDDDSSSPVMGYMSGASSMDYVAFVLSLVNFVVLRVYFVTVEL